MKKRIIKLGALALCIVFLFTGCLPSSAAPIDESKIDFVQLEEIEEGREIAVISTTFGTIKMVMFEKEAPKTVSHFKQLIKDGFYTNLPIFMQDGYNTMITGATDEYASEGKLLTEDQKPLSQETTEDLWHFSGAVSTLGFVKNSLSRDYYSDSRFFIIGNVEATRDMVEDMDEANYPLKVINAYKEHGGYPQFTGTYTVFGQVYEGLDIVDKINALSYSDKNFQREGAVIKLIELSTYHKADTAQSSEESKDE